MEKSCKKSQKDIRAIIENAKKGKPQVEKEEKDRTDKISAVEKEYMEELVDYLVSLNDEDVDEYLEIDELH